MQLVLYC